MVHVHVFVNLLESQELGAEMQDDSSTDKVLWILVVRKVL